ncbi:bifunctional 4-hydroxy-2-oxoglutarate aldolase/2-dehydro-3-deoxy-phosphogluconate aldolase [Bacillus sp. FJAT-42376]|uniref:bifunctional 4-hydroxy-2-oxoglutarate aldolase/2-dehydro-3-deoxy-phosphogluconate aldolase n=1 Tax=Bacillus sp. FJAT-42376 TaxID=2014076 RepID=UPI000F4F17E0|nr:bifunctional 4-hydroxy-2-oxoglutarate aldolase/2-dehydro-3-deoxy-phosphogluconate aldolase [Bacillus sp. FJAT-42376]AZB41964.1 bifunctional 4-hydroxy-2-oxoglutarate aldolase/2-dehydro-3-deoxy-phosphogluconate aldolase [Bacillus sp. FJAT-42376]
MKANAIQESGIVAVIRGANPETIIPIAHALKDGGVTALEITMENPKAVRVIERLSGEFHEEVLVGAGTVLDPETARTAIMAGAKFIFSPTVNLDTIRMAKRYGVISVPGAMTPTEILAAYEAGADLVKVFPANVLGPEFLKAVAGPLPHIPLMPTGGIGLDNMEAFLKAGAAAVGAGSTLVSGSMEADSGSLVKLAERASRFSGIFRGFQVK